MKLRNWDLLSTGDRESTSLLVAEDSHTHRVIQEEQT